MIITDMKTYVEAQTTPYADIQVDTLLPDKNAIMFRQIPSRMEETRYLSRKRIGTFIFEAYTKHEDAEVALAQLNTFVEVLDLPDGVTLTDETFIKAMPLSQPHFIQKTPQQEYIYMMTFEVSYQSTY